MTKEEKNRKIAEWLEPKPEAWQLDAPYIAHAAWTYDIAPGSWQPRDFFTDEAANALLLDRIIESDRRYGCPYASHPLMTRIVSMREDRKAAIVECALRLIDTPYDRGGHV